MCCGQNRTAISQTRAPSTTGRGVQTAPNVGRSSVAYFEYTGKTAMTVVGPVTGATYRFGGSGSRAAVDLRDCGYLEPVPHLVRVRSL